MISLFLSTASKYLNIAILKDNKVLLEENIYLDKDLSKMALVSIKNLIEKANMAPSDIGEIVCVSGPGSFTGLRVGATIAKSFAWSLNIKIVPVSTLFLMATSVNDDYIIPIIDARRGYVYAGIYDKNYKTILSDRYIKLEELEEQVKLLKGSYTYVSLDDYDFAKEYHPDINNMFKHLEKTYVSSFEFVPNYLKLTEAEENLNK